jgi:hypothetical protein
MDHYCCRFSPTLRGAFRLLAAALVFSPIAGCSHFESHKHIDLKPFAEQMIEVAGNIQYGLAESQPIYIRDYRNGPAMKNLRVHTAKVRAVVRGTITYSIEMVTLGESSLSGPMRAAALADYIGHLMRPVVASPEPKLHMTPARLDSTLADIRRQKTLLDALSAAQPIIDDVAYAASELFEDTKLALDAAMHEIRGKIDADNAGVKEANRQLKKMQIATALNVHYVREYRTGNRSALDTLLVREPSLREMIQSPDRITHKDLMAIEERLHYLLTSLRQSRDQLMPDLELYWKQEAEVNEIDATYNAALRTAHVAVIAWSRAHKRVAAGIVDPAEIDLIGMARRAAGDAVRGLPGVP